MNNRQLTMLQEVYFDLCDVLNSYQYKKTRIKGIEGYETLQEFLIEQRNKLAEIEAYETSEVK